MRRTTRLLLLAALGFAALFGTAAPAGATGESIEGCTVEGVEHDIQDEEVILAAIGRFEGETEGLDHESQEYQDALHEVEEIVASCIEAPNVLLPELNEIIWGAIGFLTVLFFMLKFGFPAAKRAMTERTAKIQGDLDAAEQAKADAEAVKADYESKVSDAKAEAGRIIEEARQDADRLRADQQARLNDELAAARASAQADIEAAKGQAMAELRGEVATIAIGAAESVVGANLDREAQTRLVEDYINRVQAAPSGNGQGLIMGTERDKAYAAAIAAVARAEGELAQVQDELFSLSRTLGGSEELLSTLTDTQVPVARRQQIVEDLLAGKVSKSTAATVSMVVAAGRARDLTGIADELVSLGAAEGGREVAVVRSAIDLTDDQKTRLAAALQQAVGRPVDVRVVIDPSVLGGLVAQVGDTVIDGSVRRRLDLLKQAI